MTGGAPTEKTGNTSWVQCQCGHWFHVANALLDAEAVPLHCPACHREFFTAEAKRVERVG